MLACVKFLTCALVLASFLGAIQAAARPLGKEELDKAKKVKVHAKVHIGPPEDLEGYAIAVDIKVEGAAKGLLKVAHKVCLDSMVSCRFN